MLIKSKRGPKPLGLVDIAVSVTPDQNDMLDQLVRSTGISKAALVRTALAHFGETIGFLPEGSAALTPSTRTSGPGIRSKGTAPCASPE